VLKICDNSFFNLKPVTNHIWFYLGMKRNGMRQEWMTVRAKALCPGAMSLAR
jgi:hypothetical protein